MKARTLGKLMGLVVFTTMLWVGMVIYRQATVAPVVTLTDQVALIERQYTLFMVNYVNAGFITLFCTLMFVGLSIHLREDSPFWSLAALIFVPMYAISNLVVYLSQVFLVPGLLTQFHNPQTSATAELLLGMVLHEWNGSAAGFVNGLAYALLGIPSIILGVMLYRRGKPLRLGSALLVMSGALSLMALVGIALGNPFLKSFTLVSGFVFLVALFPLGWFFIKNPSNGFTLPEQFPEKKIVRFRN